MGSVANFLRAFASGPNLRQIGTTNEQQGVSVTVNFKGAHYPKSVILHAVFFYVRYVLVVHRSRLWNRCLESTETRLLTLNAF